MVTNGFVFPGPWRDRGELGSFSDGQSALPGVVGDSLGSFFHAGPGDDTEFFGRSFDGDGRAGKIAGTARGLTAGGHRAILDTSPAVGCNSLIVLLVTRSPDARKNSVS